MTLPRRARGRSSACINHCWVVKRILTWQMMHRIERAHASQVITKLCYCPCPFYNAQCWMRIKRPLLQASWSQRTRARPMGAKAPYPVAHALTRPTPFAPQASVRSYPRTRSVWQGPPLCPSVDSRLQTHQALGTLLAAARLNQCRGLCLAQTEGSNWCGALTHICM